MQDGAVSADRAGTFAVARYYLSGFPDFAAYFLLALVFVAAFVFIYSWVTPHREFGLIRQGNVASVPAMLGALLGFALPLNAAMGGAASLVDFSIWSAIAAVVQVCAFAMARIAMPDVSERISRGEIAAGAWLGGISVIVGVLNAAAMTY